MRYDPEQKRVIYQPVTIEPREIVPRVIREDNYGGLQLSAVMEPPRSLRSLPPEGAQARLGAARQEA